jgi:hypothetical protein
MGTLALCAWACHRCRNLGRNSVGTSRATRWPGTLDSRSHCSVPDCREAEERESSAMTRFDPWIVVAALLLLCTGLSLTVVTLPKAMAVGIVVAFIGWCINESTTRKTR